MPQSLLDPLGNVSPSGVEAQLLRMFSLMGAEPVVPSRGVPAAARAWSRHPDSGTPGNWLGGLPVPAASGGLIPWTLQHVATPLSTVAKALPALP